MYLIHSKCKSWFLVSCGLFLCLTLFAPFAKGQGKSTSISSVKPIKPAKYTGDCSRGYISVHYNDHEDYLSACEGVQRAERFFKDYLNYSSKEPVQIIFGESHNFADKSLKTYLNRAVGVYTFDERVIILKPGKAIRQRKYLGILPVSKNLHSSSIAHELAHHIHYTYIEKQKKIYDITGSEFLAAIVELETMADPEKTQIIAYHKEFVLDRDSLDLFFYQLNPGIFLVSSYLDYLKTPDIINYVFKGEFVFNTPEREPY